MPELCFVSDRRPGEPDILASVADCVLILIAENAGIIMRKLPPPGGWTHAALCALNIPSQDPLAVLDAYLGDVWVGSSEV